MAGDQARRAAARAAAPLRRHPDAAVFVVATATIAAIAGGGGLGDIIVNQAAYRGEGVVAAALCVSLLALAADAALGLVQRALTPQGLKQKPPAFEPDVRPVV